MSGLWDTPTFWAPSEADEALRAIPEIAPGALADSLGKSAANYNGDPEMVALSTAALRHRAAAGVRLWPLREVDARERPDASAVGELIGAVHVAALIDDGIPW